jgi:hypothetical protein
MGSVNRKRWREKTVDKAVPNSMPEQGKEMLDLFDVASRKAES